MEVAFLADAVDAHASEHLRPLSVGAQYRGQMVGCRMGRSGRRLCMGSEQDRLHLVSGKRAGQTSADLRLDGNGGGLDALDLPQRSDRPLRSPSQRSDRPPETSGVGYDYITFKGNANMSVRNINVGIPCRGGLGTKFTIPQTRP